MSYLKGPDLDIKPRWNLSENYFVLHCPIRLSARRDKMVDNNQEEIEMTKKYAIQTQLHHLLFYIYNFISID